jgi:penicillin-binding protein 1C
LPDFGRYLLSPSAAATVVEILQQTPAPKGFVPRHLTKSRAIAYKTGTSYGFRDALAAGLMGDYTALVWVGRPDGGARIDETGRDVAAPLLFEVFDQIDAPRARLEAKKRPIEPAQSSEPLSSEHLTKNQETARLSVLFPPDKAVLFVSAEAKKPDGTLLKVVPLKLSARGQGSVRWYQAGEEILPDANGDRFFSPLTEGFYDLKVVDEIGQTKTVKVRVRAVLSKPSASEKPD